MPWLPRHKFLDWPDDAADLTIPEVINLYENGFAGCKYDPAAWEQLRAFMPNPDGEEIAYQSGFTDSGAGKLVIPFVHVLEMFPGCWPVVLGQQTGDCVSWGTRDAALGTMVCDIVSGQVDEKSGKPEEKPEVSAEGISHGVLSTEAFYWHRGYDGQGWYCPAAAQIALSTTGLVVRQNYPEAGIDLTRYSGRNATKYGRSKPPESIVSVGRQRLVHQVTDVRSFEARRDFLHNGYFILDCGGEGFSDQRDQNGVSRRRGNWAHSMSEIAADDRDVVKQLYGQPLVLINNENWAKWNKGPRDIIQSAVLVPPTKRDLWILSGIVNPTTGNIMIPDGTFWALWSEVKNREALAFSGVNGWPAKTLPFVDWMA